jgi:two-component system sensor histidine kinase YesM
MEVNVHHVRALDEIQARAMLEKEIKNAQLRLKEAELKALQAQINPHFLYNTLDAIQWLTYQDDGEKIRRAVHALGQLMRHSLDRKNSIVPIRTEVEQIKNYLSIVKLRFEDRLSVHINVEEEVMDCLVPKLILQPLVENALRHGLEPLATKGNLWVDGWMHGVGIVMIEIADDGTGITTEIRNKMQRLFEESNTDSADDSVTSHVGLANVQRRLKRFFGNAFSMEITDRRGRGTSVRLRIPKTGTTVEAQYAEVMDSSHCG